MQSRQIPPSDDRFEIGLPFRRREGDPRTRNPDFQHCHIDESVNLRGISGDNYDFPPYCSEGAVTPNFWHRETPATGRPKSTTRLCISSSRNSYGSFVRTADLFLGAFRCLKSRQITIDSMIFSLQRMVSNHTMRISHRLDLL
jgi:hypothetical protein